MQRKTVTVLFCDVVGSTALGESVDPESLRAVLGRYFERMKSIVERYGGTVEKFIGDAVVAVFGVPIAHEDDALRALRAAADMRGALPELGLEARIGVNTGEVVTETDERLVTGDAVNVAARLEQAAQPGEILVGASTLALVRDAAEAEEVARLVLKGRAQPVAAYRLVAVHEAPERRHDTAFVGRGTELGAIQEAWRRAVEENGCELITVMADAGVGKSRLLAEALPPLGARAVSGRCLPYGEGITYWPVVEALRQLTVEPADPAAAKVIDALLGETDAPTSADEIAWAVRKTLEEAASERPLAVVFEDIHWGEETFLDLVEHIALLSVGAPILLACTARPELLDRRPQWPVALRLKPLPPDDVERLIPRGLDASFRERIIGASGGVPLFVTEMLAMTEQASDLTVPPTLQALLTARLDQLDSAERRVLECGAVEGEVFHRGAVQALLADEPQVSPRLAALVRRELIGPGAAQLPGEDGFRFRHMLIRDAAYDALPKATRAELHERFARWLEERATGLVELDEILGYHLEQAWRYRSQLDLGEDRPLVARARRHLRNAGRRAVARQDYAAAISFLSRAHDLLADEELDTALEVELAEARFFAGGLQDACRALVETAERAASAGDRSAELLARIEESYLRMDVEPEGIADKLDSLTRSAVPVFEGDGDDFALHLLHSARAVAAHQRGQMQEELDARERSLDHARRAGLPHPGGWTLPSLASARLRGRTPVPGLLAWIDGQEADGAQDPYLRAVGSVALGMLGHFEQARATLHQARGELADRGAALPSAVIVAQLAVELELLAGDPAAAKRLGEEGSRLLEEAGERSFLSTALGYLGQALCELERFREAGECAARARALGASDDALTQVLSRQVSARVAAGLGDHSEAPALAREAVALAAETDLLSVQGDGYRTLADVLLLAGNSPDATVALEQALERYDEKGNVVMADRTRARVAEARAGAAQAP